MRVHRQVLALTLICAMPLAALAAEAKKGKNPKELTVGEFAVMLAATTGSPRQTDAGKAADQLVKAGVPLGDLSATLSEQKLAEILDHYGVETKNAAADTAISRSKAEAALLMVKSSLSQGPGATMAGASTSPVPSTIDDCYALSNHGECTNCCKALGTTTARQCSRLCNEFRKGSSPEPIP
ncbi:MAG TPA: hypothetical protein VFT43_10155 [Candidatus Polarisedimenticolia bacterium]|nr:hypothetical protein [Candidatus Polarisedimenticolia bacterium]